MTRDDLLLAEAEYRRRADQKSVSESERHHSRLLADHFYREAERSKLPITGGAERYAMARRRSRQSDM